MGRRTSEPRRPTPAHRPRLRAAPTTGLLHETENAALLVLGNRGRNALTGLLVGSTALALIGLAHCPVVLVRNGADGNSGHTGPIVVGIDGTEASEAAVAFAFAEASAQGATLVALHAWAESVFETALAGPDAPLDWARRASTCCTTRPHPSRWWCGRRSRHSMTEATRGTRTTTGSRSRPGSVRSSTSNRSRS